MNHVRTDAQSIIKQAQHVAINTTAIENLATKIESPQHWLTVSPFPIMNLSTDEQLSFLFVLNSISFSYWGEPKWSIDYKYGNYDGAQGMLAALGKAVETGRPILQPRYLKTITKEELGDILQGNVEIPLLQERAAYLQQLGDIVTSKYNESYTNIVTNNALDLVDRLTTFPLFRDTATYNGKKVQFNKRAQLLAADIHQLVRPLQNVAELTACADYKLPQVLRRHRVLEYSTKLENIARSKTEVSPHSREVIEVRAATIAAVDMLAEAANVFPYEANDWLWLEGQIKLPTDEPYLHYRTTAN